MFEKLLKLLRDNFARTDTISYRVQWRHIQTMRFTTVYSFELPHVKLLFIYNRFRIHSL